MVKKNKEKFIVFYDSWCPLCTKAKEKIEQYDTKKRITLLSFREREVFEKYNLGGQNVENRIYARDEVSGKSFSGIHTVRQIARRIPKYKVFAPFIAISIYTGLGTIIYDYIASKRNIVPVGHCDEEGCPIHWKEDKDHL